MDLPMGRNAQTILSDRLTWCFVSRESLHDHSWLRFVIFQYICGREGSQTGTTQWVKFLPGWERTPVQMVTHLSIDGQVIWLLPPKRGQVLAPTVQHSQGGRRQCRALDHLSIGRSLLAFHAHDSPQTYVGKGGGKGGGGISSLWGLKSVPSPKKKNMYVPTVVPRSEQKVRKKWIFKKIFQIGPKTNITFYNEFCSAHIIAKKYWFIVEYMLE